MSKDNLSHEQWLRYIKKERTKIYMDRSTFMEIVDEFATQITEMNYGADTYGESSEVGQEGVVMFTEEAQDYYNEMYGEYEDLLNKLGNIYPNKI